MKSNHDGQQHSLKLFEGERALITTGCIGFILSIIIAIYIYFQGAIVLPEGNMENAFSFNAAIGIFILSIAAIMPLAKFNNRTRKMIRWLLISGTIYSYAIETIQNFRGINPRFSQAGSLVDGIAGIVFGIVSLSLVVLIIILTIQFFRLRPPHERPLLMLGIRYAFVSAIMANAAGLWMIILQSRFTGDAGNIIVLHGIGFHALQTLILPALLIETAPVHDQFKRRLLHVGSIAWTIMILLIGIQTGLGRDVFELSLLPILGSVFLIVWVVTAFIAFTLFLKGLPTKQDQAL
ncbi:hypothetical protein [Bacillus sp. JCM 19034]|uniref:hypothetical protein n=1 Tax=Bacillus sp. JCM 19034 TaxID=1481928 RepID=UPI0007804825|nr:hypothetical protein [Bacillus sp. JCM 19034]